MRTENKTSQSNVLPFVKEAQDAAKRSLLKTLSWRALASVDTFVIAYLATGKITIGATIVSAEIFTKMTLYYVHERGWAHVRWGAGKAKAKEAATPAVDSLNIGRHKAA